MSRNVSPLADVKSYFRIREILRETSPDIVHCHSAKAGFLGRLAAKSLRGNAPATIYTPHAMPCYLSRTYHRLERFAGYLTDVIVAVSASEKVDIKRWKVIAPNRIELIPLHVSCDNVCPPCPTPDTFTVGGCGRISRQKNAALFFQAGIQVLEQHPGARLLWIGDYSNDLESEKVKSIIASCPHADRITVTGWSSTPQELLATLDVFCMFSIYESFGYVTADAMSIGIPVVATLATGTRDLIEDGRTGLITENDPACAAHQILRLSKSPELGRRLVRNAREYIQEAHKRSNTLSRIEALYRRCAPQVHERHARDDRCTR
jgi:glycosyltransferase involved in cell wall biosynthesis